MCLPSVNIFISVCDQQHGEACPNWLADGIRVNWDINNPLEDSASQQEFDELCHSSQKPNHPAKFWRGVFKEGEIVLEDDDIVAVWGDGGDDVVGDVG